MIGYNELFEKFLLSDNEHLTNQSPEKIMLYYRFAELHIIASIVDLETFQQLNTNGIGNSCVTTCSDPPN